MFETILVPLDGSELSESALAPALELKEKFGSHLVLLRSIEPESHRLAQPAAYMDTSGAAVANVELIEEVIEQERSETKTYLQVLQQRTGTENVEALMIEEQPADAIAQVAKDKNATLIVMSSHGRGGLGRALFGSVADAVLHQSSVPVLLVRHHEDKKD